MFLSLILPLTAVLVPSASPQAFCADKGGQLGESTINDILSVANNRRRKLANGRVKDGGAPTAFPKAKLMNKLAWDCDLEKAALDALGSSCSPVPVPAAANSAKNTGFFYDDKDEEQPSVSGVVSKWLDEVKAAAWPDTSKLSGSDEDPVPMLAAVIGNNAEKFANLIRSDIQKIGCAELACPTEFKTYVFCLTDKGALKDGDPIYTIGSPCDNDAKCTVDPNRKCDIDMGLCYEEVPTTTAVTTTAATTTAATTAATTTAASYSGELPTGTSSQCPGNVGMTDELRMHFLDTQNYRRSILAKGQVPRPSGRNLPNGANIIKLKLNCNLEKEAIEEVRQCPAAKKPHATYGKNFDTFASSTTTPTYVDAIKKAVTNWWKVSRTESNGPGMQVTFRSNHVNQPVETYTQIAWANTKDIGCAVAKCTSSYTVICLYEPKGNIVDQVMYQIGSPCAACPSGTTCDSALGLCVQN